MNIKLNFSRIYLFTVGQIKSIVQTKVISNSIVLKRGSPHEVVHIT
jgi:hypothetical protein